VLLVPDGAKIAAMPTSIGSVLRVKGRSARSEQGHKAQRKG
jgi:hypothetical protein